MRLGLIGEPGVSFVGVDWQAGEASVVFDPAVTTGDAIVVAAIFRQPTAHHSYRASLRSEVSSVDGFGPKQ